MAGPLASRLSATRSWWRPCPTWSSCSGWRWAPAQRAPGAARRGGPHAEPGPDPTGRGGRPPGPRPAPGRRPGGAQPPTGSPGGRWLGAGGGRALRGRRWPRRWTGSRSRPATCGAARPRRPPAGSRSSCSSPWSCASCPPALPRLVTVLAPLLSRIVAAPRGRLTDPGLPYRRIPRPHCSNVEVVPHGANCSSRCTRPSRRPTGRRTAPASVPGSGRLRGAAGQTTAEYALVLVGAAAIASLLIAWATGTDSVGKLMDFVIAHVIGSVR